MVLDNALRFMKAAIVKFKFKSALLAAKACLTANMACLHLIGPCGVNDGG
jgi:hypothetical protein